MHKDLRLSRSMAIVLNPKLRCCLQARHRSESVIYQNVPRTANRCFRLPVAAISPFCGFAAILLPACRTGLRTPRAASLHGGSGLRDGQHLLALRFPGGEFRFKASGETGLSFGRSISSRDNARKFNSPTCKNSNPLLTFSLQHHFGLVVSGPRALARF